MDAVRLGRPGESSSPSSRNYDVFLSFRGEGTAKSFTNQLYAALVQAGLNIFKAGDNDNDDEDVIERAIEQSRVLIIVFSSKEYSDGDATSWSYWCVEKFAKILEFTRTLGKNLVFPVYYGVDQAQVKARITKALSRYEEELEVEMEDELRKDKVKKWRKALRETIYWSELEPRILLNPAKTSDQSGFIREIIEEIQLNLKEEYSRQKERKQDDESWWFGKEFLLVNSRLSELPENPDCPILKKLFLQHNSDLAAIPISFFNRMPALEVLDLSDTNIKSLPPSIACLDRLRELIMRDCQLLMELPAEIGALCNLKVLDLEGTKLICLPKEIRRLLKLVHLKFSLYRCSDKYRESRRIEAIIPRGTLLKFYHLKELSIDVDPNCGWWDVEVEAIIDELSYLRNLQTLKLYLPRVELLQQILQVSRGRALDARFLPLMYPTLSNFRLIVGRHEHRIVSCLTVDLQVEFEKLEKCLKYVNGEEGRSTDDRNIGQALKHASALFLERHWSIEKLSSVFKIGEMDKLKFCLLVECNEMKAVVDGGDFYQQGDKYNNNNNKNVGGKPTLGSLQYLGIHYMKSLEWIWKGPIVSGCLSSLRILAINTCPNLSTIFSPSLLLRNLTNLKELTLEDCPKLKNVVTAESSVLEYSTHHEYFFLPSLEKISLLHLPELVSIFSDQCVAPKLERMLVYNCPNLKTLSPMEMLSKKFMKEIKGEREWWEALEWHKSDDNYLLGIFSPLKSDGDLVNEFAEAENQSLNTLRMFQTSTHSQVELLKDIGAEPELIKLPNEIEPNKVQEKVAGSQAAEPVERKSRGKDLSNSSQLMKKVVLKVELHDDKVKLKAMKAVSRLAGVESIAMDMKDRKMTVTGYIDPVTVLGKLRKVCIADILSVGPAKEPEKKKEEPNKTYDKKKDSKDDAPKVPLAYYQQPYYQQYRPLIPSQYYATSVEEDPNACVIC